MPRPPTRRHRNGSRRRLPVRDTSVASRHLAINATKQIILRTVHFQIGSAQILIRKLITALGLLELINFYRPDEKIKNYQHCVLAILAHATAALRVYFRLDSFIADIPPDEEEEEQERRVERRILPRLSFETFNDNELRRMTRFPAVSLMILKDFFNLPTTIYLHPSENETRMEYDPHQGCHLFTDEELILFSLYHFAHGVNVTIMADRFCGSIDRWVYGFKYFVRYVHPLIYPNIVGLQSVSEYVTSLSE